MQFIKVIFILLVILSTSCSNNSEMREELEKIATDFPTTIDTFSIKCLQGNNSNECVDTISEGRGFLTCKFYKYLNCATTKIDTFILKNDTIHIFVNSADGERYTCDCYFDVFIRIKNTSCKSKTIMVNGEPIGSRQADLDAKEI